MLIGGAGFLGTNMIFSLMQAGHELFVIDRDCSHVSSLLQSPLVSFFNAEMTECSRITSILDKYSIECVINLVSSIVPAGLYDEFERELSSCLLPSFRLIQEMVKRNINYIFISSGGAVYGNNTFSAAVCETSLCQPISFYGYSKKMVEEYIQFVARQSDFNYLIVRPSNPYGLHQNKYKKQGFIGVALDKILNGETIEIWGDGSVVRDYVWVQDFSAAVTALLDKQVWKSTVNIGSGIGLSLKQVISILESVTQRTADVCYLEARTVDVKSVVLDVTKLKSLIEYQPLHPEVGIQLYYQNLLNA